MATIITKNSSTASAVPLAANLTQGELAVNVTDKKLYTKDSGGNVVQVGGDVTLAGTQTLTNKTLTSPTLTAPVLGTPASGTVTNLTGTASININGTVGATTPTTGAFTTIRSSTGASSAIFGGGSSSNEVVTITAQTGGLGIGLGIQNSSSNLSGISFPTNASATTSYTYITADGRSGASGFIKSYVNDAVVSTLTSTGLGIGTTSFTAKLTVKPVANTYTGGALALVGASSGTSYITSIGGNLYVSNDGSTDQLVLNAAGNLGLGVTPSAWSSSYRALQMGSISGSIAAFIGNAQTFVTSNAYNDGAWKYTNTTGAGYYQIAGVSSGAHAWYTAPSGTAGAAITFTQVLSVEGSKSLSLQGATPQTGTGITFPATQSASTDANTLDDYEEGTWTPNQGSGVTVVGAFSSVASYTKIGRLVYVTGYLTGATSIACTGAGGILTTNLPFTSGVLTLGIAMNGSQSANSTMFLTGTTLSLVTTLSATSNIYFTATYSV